MTLQNRATDHEAKEKNDRDRCENQCGFFIFFHSLIMLEVKAGPLDVYFQRSRANYAQLPFQLRRGLKAMIRGRCRQMCPLQRGRALPWLFRCFFTASDRLEQHVEEKYLG